jgi:hypothetical protein
MNGRPLSELYLRETAAMAGVLGKLRSTICAMTAVQKPGKWPLL